MPSHRKPQTQSTNTSTSGTWKERTRNAYCVVPHQTMMSSLTKTCDNAKTGTVPSTKSFSLCSSMITCHTQFTHSGSSRRISAVKLPTLGRGLVTIVVRQAYSSFCVVGFEVSVLGPDSRVCGLDNVSLAQTLEVVSYSHLLHLPSNDKPRSPDLIAMHSPSEDIFRSLRNYCSFPPGVGSGATMEHPGHHGRVQNIQP